MKEKYYLSASRAWSFLNNRRAFIKNYVFNEPAPIKRTWSIGERFQELVYSYLLNKKIQVCNNLKEFRALGEEDIFGIYGDMVPLYEELLIVMPMIFNKSNIDKMTIEKLAICHEQKLTGRPDILLPNAIVDIKTSTGDLKNWAKNNSLIRLGMQAFIYQAILSKKEELPLFFLAVEAVYPYRILIKSLSPEWVQECGELLRRIQTQYIKWCAEKGKIISEITGNSDWLRNDKNRDYKAKIYEKIGIKLSEVVFPSVWDMREMEESIEQIRHTSGE